MPAPTKQEKLAVRAQAIRLFQSWRADDEVAILDTETTGASTEAEIVEISAATMGGEVLFDQLVRPLSPIPKAATRIHGITNADVRGKPTFADLAGAVRERLGDRLVVTWNAAFDRRIVEGEFARLSQPAPGASWDCAMLAFSRFNGEWNPGRGGYRWKKLEEAARIMRLRFNPQSHRALEDCRLVWRVVNAVSKIKPTDLFSEALEDLKKT